MKFYLAKHQQQTNDVEQKFQRESNLLLSYTLESFITANSETTVAIFTRNEEVEAELKAVEGKAVIVQPSESELPLVRIDQCNWRITNEVYGIVVELYHQPHEIDRLIHRGSDTENRFRSDCWRT